MKSNKHSAVSYYRKISPMIRAEGDEKVRAGENCFAVDGSTDFRDSCTENARTLKRVSPFKSSHVEACNGKAVRRRIMEKNDESQVVISGCSSTLLRKVDATEECRGKLYMQTSAREAPAYCVKAFHARRLQLNDSDVDECSVGSCSIVSSSRSKLCSRDVETLSSEAESFYGRGNKEEKCMISLGDNVAARIHRLELHAYRCTLEALYACGPLNWEQEAMLTNLRISLNISNDEHLMELRNLISSGVSIYCSCDIELCKNYLAASKAPVYERTVLKLIELVGLTSIGLTDFSIAMVFIASGGLKLVCLQLVTVVSTANAAVRFSPPDV